MSLDLFRCESITLRTHWVLVVMDHFTRRIIGFGIHAGLAKGEAVCRMFKQAIQTATALPKYLSSGHDPLSLDVSSDDLRRILTLIGQYFGLTLEMPPDIDDLVTLD